MDHPELPILWVALLLYVVAGVVAIFGQAFGRRPERAVLALLVAGLLALTLAIGLRWVRLDYGPFATMFEILVSNVWSLSLVFALVYWRLPAIRPTASVVLPLLFLMMAWLLVTDPTGSRLPPSFDTVWLWIHIGFAKVFLGAVLIAVGLAGTILLRRLSGGRVAFARMPNDASLDELAFRFMAIGLVFDTLMLISGAIWAQEAWGRYWGWDPLETAAFVTWLLLAVSLHLRVTFKPRPVLGAVLVMVVFVMGFTTFFGIPFLTDKPHQGTF
jgi:ABC-type transport system involved in cytochrome c biogenesis permease subunit